MFIEPERLFCGIKITFSNRRDRRNQLKANILKALEYLKSWLKIVNKETEVLKGLIESLADGLMGKEYSENSDDESDGKDKE
jgi:hypothetical protein